MADPISGTMISRLFFSGALSCYPLILLAPGLSLRPLWGNRCYQG